jgi:hypothetical protein
MKMKLHAFITSILDKSKYQFLAAAALFLIKGPRHVLNATLAGQQSWSED